MKKSPTIKIVKNVFLTRHEKYNINSDCKNRLENHKIIRKFFLNANVFNNSRINLNQSYNQFKKSIHKKQTSSVCGLKAQLVLLIADLEYGHDIQFSSGFIIS